MISMDARAPQENKSIGRTSNSKIIMAKQFFETMGGNSNTANTNMPR